MAVHPLLLNQIHAVHEASIAALGALDNLLYTIDPDDDVPLINFHVIISNTRTYVDTVVSMAQDSTNTIDNLLDEGENLPDYIKEQNIQESIHELPNIMDGVIEEYHLDNKPDMIDHLHAAKDYIESIDDWCRMIIQHAEQHQDDSNNGSNNGSNGSNVSYNSNKSNGGRRKKRTMRKRRTLGKHRGHSKKRKQTHRKRTHRKRTHRKRTHRKRTHRK